MTQWNKRCGKSSCVLHLRGFDTHETGGKRFQISGGERRVKVIVVMTWCLLAGLILICACKDARQEIPNDYIIQVNDRKVTVEAFQRQFDQIKSDYTETTEIPAAEQAEMKRYLLNQLIEKLILLERAEELDIHVTDGEIDRRIEDIKADYPEGTFKEVLLEQAVIFHQWKEDLKTRMLMEKVIQNDLDPRVTLTQADISAYYEKYFIRDENESDSILPDESLNETLFQLARNQKKEEAYRTWINELQNRYQVDVNLENWEKINNSDK
jgi:hypothetical protein